ncbi:glyoxylate reductase [Malassezia sp. CBS 17886]|nr:glyoxylate reductase [Malassezia sp. CBS 17886]
MLPRGSQLRVAQAVAVRAAARRGALETGVSASDVQVRAVHASRAAARAANRTDAPRILLMDDIQLAASELRRLEQSTNMARNTTTTRAELIAAFQPGGQYADVVGLYRHFGGARSVRVSGRFDEELVAALPATLRFIVHNGAGYDQLDIAALTRRGIQASNVPTVVNDATADTALFLLLGSLRRFPLALAQLRSGTFNQQFPFVTATDPEKRVLGIVGAGGIGRAVARKAAHALGMHVLYHNRTQLSPALEADGMPPGRPMSYVPTLHALLAQSDAVSVNCPLTAETRHLISAPELAHMQRHAVLVNTARGPIVDEAALVDALNNDVIAGAGLDVYENEPSVHEGLLALADSKALLLPHVGTLSLQTQTEMEAACLKNLEHGLATGSLAFTVREQEGVQFG